MKISTARRLADVDDHLARIERLQKQLRIGLSDIAEQVRVAAAQLRRDERIRIKGAGQVAVAADRSRKPRLKK